MDIRPYLLLSQSVRVCVLVSPTVEVSPSTQVRSVGETATVTCHASGRPQPRISWQLNEQDLHSSHSHYLLTGKCSRALHGVGLVARCQSLTTFRALRCPTCARRIGVIRLCLRISDVLNFGESMMRKYTVRIKQRNVSRGEACPFNALRDMDNLLLARLHIV